MGAFFLDQIRELDFDFLTHSIQSVPLTVNNSIFLTSLKNLAADWQSDYIRQAENHELFGSYSQTELAHGSDVQALKVRILSNIICLIT